MLAFFKKKKNNDIGEMIEEKSGILHEEEKDMIKGIVGLSETPVKSIMVPRTDVVAVPIDQSIEEIIKTVIKSGHSRIPVYSDTIDNVIGFLYAKDLLPYLAEKSPQDIDLKKMLRPVLFVPEGKMIDELLKEFKEKKVHIAVVVDEYGGMAGIVCLENILEEIVGEIQDEYDNEEEEIKKISKNIYECDARIQISDLNEDLGIELPEESSDTLGGFVFNLYGKIPRQGEKISYENLEFEIIKMEGHKINRIRLTIKQEEENNKENKAKE